MSAHRAMQELSRSPSASLVVLAMLSGILAACSTESDPARGSKAGNPGARPATASDRVAQMVAAVPGSEASSLVDLRFELQGRPAAGQPVDLSVAVVPAVDNLRGFSVVFQPSELVEVRRGAEFSSPGQPGKGAAYFHSLSIVPRRDGVSYLSAVVLADQDGVSVARSFAIPLIVGDSFAASAATP